MSHTAFNKGDQVQAQEVGSGRFIRGHFVRFTNKWEDWAEVRDEIGVKHLCHTSSVKLATTKTTEENN